MCKTYLHTNNKSEMHNTPSHRKEENRLLSHECTHQRHDTFMCLLGVTLRRAKNDAATSHHAKTNNHNDYHNHHRRVLTRDQKPPSIEQIATNSDNSRNNDILYSWSTSTFLARRIFSLYYGDNAMKKNSHQYKYNSSFYTG